LARSAKGFLFCVLVIVVDAFFLYNAGWAYESESKGGARAFLFDYLIIPELVIMAVFLYLAYYCLKPE
jgi:hypothetical protein